MLLVYLRLQECFCAFDGRNSMISTIARFKLKSDDPCHESKVGIRQQLFNLQNDGHKVQTDDKHVNYFWNRFHSLSTNKNETGFLQARLQFLGFGGTKEGSITKRKTCSCVQLVYIWIMTMQVCKPVVQSVTRITTVTGHFNRMATILTLVVWLVIKWSCNCFSRIWDLPSAWVVAYPNRFRIAQQISLKI